MAFGRFDELPDPPKVVLGETAFHATTWRSRTKTVARKVIEASGGGRSRTVLGRSGRDYRSSENALLTPRAIRQSARTAITAPYPSTHPPTSANVPTTTLPEAARNM